MFHVCWRLTWLVLASFVKPIRKGMANCKLSSKATTLLCALTSNVWACLTTVNTAKSVCSKTLTWTNDVLCRKNWTAWKARQPIHKLHTIHFELSSIPLPDADTPLIGNKALLTLRRP
jgi:hypothetical protein